MAHDDLSRLIPSVRDELVADWWTLREGSPGFADLPANLRSEMAQADRPKENPESSRYDPLVMHGLRARYHGVRNDYLANRLGVPTAAIVGDPEALHECPCCGFESLPVRHEYRICPVCFWEDTGDGSGFSSPNHMTLTQGRANFEKFGACARKHQKHVDPEGRLKYRRRVT